MVNDLRKGYFHNNWFVSNAARKGGAMFVWSNSSSTSMNTTALQVENTTFVANSALYFGGAISSLNTSTHVSNCRFEANRAPEGGAVKSECDKQELTFHLEQSFIVANGLQNNDRSIGGGISLQATNIVAKHVEFKDNKASQGAGVYLSNSRAELKNCVFKNNTAALAGAVFAVSDSVLLLDNTQLAENKANTGGAVTMSQSLLFVQSCDFVSNAANSGGAIQILADDKHNHLHIFNSTFIDSEAPAGSVIFVTAITKYEPNFLVCELQNRMKNNTFTIHQRNPFPQYDVILPIHINCTFEETPFAAGNFGFVREQ